jgi:hypothetical protein
MQRVRARHQPLRTGFLAPKSSEVKVQKAPTENLATQSEERR